MLKFTVAVDERRTPRAHGFFIEVDGDGVGQSVFTVIIIYSSSFMPTLTALSFIPTGPNAHLALPRLHAHFVAGIEAYARFVATQFVGCPTLRVLAPSMFAAYRD